MWPFGPRSLGGRGEQLACRWLRRRGCSILARNFRCQTGEIDIIALEPPGRDGSTTQTILFVEVKTRSDDTYTQPQAAVDAQKQRRLRKAAAFYLTLRPEGLQYPRRFDILAIVIRPGERPQITHIPAAFW